ncbi:MAG: phenylalanine--tRNA ligase subunit beta [Azospirillum sp.]|nr:phenylalanine--tRNA ligase subunit beta [Azospirillum sp.]MCA3265387.1 phenylalanine--tRNA ligase subunit beta [Azospirillum sp.]
MKFTLSWLKTHLATDLSAEALAEKLTAVGLELESLTNPAKALAPFKVAYVVEAKPHPDADRLRVCLVDTGTEKIQVVCGAPNARTGMKGVFAPAGVVVPGTGLLLKAGQIRGQASNGMLVSMREMGLGEDHDGIIDLPADAPVGVPFAGLLGLDDPLFDVAITPNRADCLGVRGIARDLAAAGAGTLKPLPIAAVAGAYPSPIKIDLSALGASGACPVFVGRHFRGLKNGPSPKWLQDRLTSVGLRPISALVDITNFFTLDLNRPLHVFDAKKLKGDLHLKPAQGGESFEALDKKTYAMAGGETLICDAGGAVSLAGVIGGTSTGCDFDTTEVFLEVALFDPIRTAATGRHHQILSDARYRFERGLDPAFVMDGMEAATRMILDLCGGEASAPAIAGAVPDTRRSYALRGTRVATLGGLDVAPARQKAILESLGFGVAAKGGDFDVTPPSWRADVVGEADLVEEVCRIEGYDSIAATRLPREGAMPPLALTPAQRRSRDAKRVLAGLGLNEAVTFSFMRKDQAAMFAAPKPELEVANPISADLDYMRPSVVPNLASAAARNAARGLGDCALFEVGPIFDGIGEKDQRLVAGVLRAGAAVPRHWGQAARAVDAFDAKADALDLLRGLGLSVENVAVAREAPAWFHPGRSGALKLGPKTVLAWFGELHPRVAQALDLEGPVAACEVFLDAIPAPKAKGGRQRPALKLSPFQPLERDFAFVVDASVAADAILRAARSADKALIGGASVFDVYQGKGVPEGKKSVAIAVRLQPVERTLTEQDLDAVAQKIVAAVAKATGASLRG